MGGYNCWGQDQISAQEEKQLGDQWPSDTSSTASCVLALVVIECG